MNFNDSPFFPTKDKDTRRCFCISIESAHCCINVIYFSVCGLLLQYYKKSFPGFILMEECAFSQEVLLVIYNNNKVREEGGVGIEGHQKRKDGTRLWSTRERNRSKDMHTGETYTMKRGDREERGGHFGQRVQKQGTAVKHIPYSRQLQSGVEIVIDGANTFCANGHCNY